MSNALERRDQMITLLCEIRYAKIEYLANYFGVSKRTISNDILELSLSYPIYSKCGKEEGGVYVAKGYYRDKDYLNSEQEKAIKSTLDIVDEKTRIVLMSIIDKFARPKAN